MSDIVEKTIASLPSILTGAKPNTTSRAFQTFIKNLGTIQTKYDEELFIQKELSIERQRLSQPGMSTSQTRECLVRLLYCYMLGYDVAFAHIAAVKLAQQGALLEKRAGYLICGLLLNENDELVMLLVNTIQKDLWSSNVLEVCVALTAAGQLMSPEVIPAILPLVQEKLKHPKELVRRRALLCLHQLYKKAPDLLRHTHPLFQQALGDKDPGVMWAALHFYLDLAKDSPSSLEPLTPTLVHILTQVCSRQLSTLYDFHSVPAPWLQILLLRMLAKMGHNNQGVSEQLYPVLREVLHRTDPSHKIGLAVIYECLETILHIYPHPALVEHAANCVGKFLSSKSINLRYLGLKALASVVQINPSYAVSHQEVVIECLEHEDLTIQQRTLELLYRMTNSENVEVIVKRLILHLSSIIDVHGRADLINKVLEVTQKYCKNKSWYYDTISQVLLVAGSATLSEDVPDQVIQVMSEGSDNPTSPEAKQHVVTVAWQRFQQGTLPPPLLLQIDCWVLGEYSRHCVEPGASEIMNGLCQILQKTNTCQSQAAVLEALTKLASSHTLPADILPQLQTHLLPGDTQLQQQLRELQGLCQLRSNGISIVNLHNEIDIEQMDFSLSFLDDFVADALERGSQPYKPAVLRLPSTTESKGSNMTFSSLNFGPYDSPSVGSQGTGSSPFSPGQAGSSAGGSLGSDGMAGSISKIESGLKRKGVRQVWGRDGVLKKKDSLPDLQLSEDTMQVSTGEPAQSPPPEAVTAVTSKEQEVQDQKRELASALFRGISPPSQVASGSAPL